ncbi:ATP-binding protein [Nitrogeniibacter aestuarii]|uniref:ATP-binding protein n=1 Tax=Nitrogeniibacter aestuarii TaxID=2815343 RepID=UPI001E46F618|nr:ATP-binding protein [Nitrogeniibacter aestuarii]
MAGKTYSLRHRLIGILVVVVGVLWISSGVMAYRTAHHEADEVFDAQLVQVAETLVTLATLSEVEHVAHEMAEHSMRYDLPLRYQVWSKDDGKIRLLLRSPDAPRQPMVSHTGFSQQKDGKGTLWRYYGYAEEEHGYFVVVGQNHSAREEVATELALHLLLPMIVGLPLMALGVWWAVGRALSPLQATATTVGNMSPDALEPVARDTRLPSEIEPLVGAINRLLVRIHDAMENERRFTADAAHELRTPLAALKVQAQVAARTADEQARRRALDQVGAAVDRMTHLVEQLLTLARLQPEAAAGECSPVDLAVVAEQVCAEIAPAILARQQELDLDARSTKVCGNPVWLEVLVRNLVDNAMRYTPAGGHIQVNVSVVMGRATVAVIDDGPGMVEAERQSLTARFARGSGAQGESEGVGLGLSIVQRVVSLHGGELEFTDGLKREGGCGLGVVVRLPEVREAP